MIFSQDLLFLHVPKTAGMSVSRCLLEVLPRPVYYSADRFDNIPADAGVHRIQGIRHETLAEARDMVRLHGFELAAFPVILAVLRNPYEIEVSRYKYMQYSYAWLSGPIRELAMNEDFATFALNSPYHAGKSRPLESYFLLEGKVLPNLKILRYENLVGDLQDALRRLGIERIPELPHENKSFHADIRLYYTKAAEEIVYQKYRWAFDAGWYERFDPGDRSRVDTLMAELHDLKLELCAERQAAQHLAESYPELEKWAHDLERRLAGGEGPDRGTLRGKMAALVQRVRRRLRPGRETRVSA